MCVNASTAFLTSGRVADIEQEYFAEVDDDYILDRFNLTGLNAEVVQEYSRALDLITDSLSESRRVLCAACHT